MGPPVLELDSSNPLCISSTTDTNIKKSRAVFVKLWLITVVLVYFVMVGLILITVVFETYGPMRRQNIRQMTAVKWIVIVFFIVFTGFMIYLWIVVINYYWQLTSSPENESTEKKVVYQLDYAPVTYTHWRQRTYHPRYYY